MKEGGRNFRKGWIHVFWAEITQCYSTRTYSTRRISHAATSKPGKLDKEWAKLDLAPMRMGGKTELPEASLIMTSVKPDPKETNVTIQDVDRESMKFTKTEREDPS